MVGGQEPDMDSHRSHRAIVALLFTAFASLYVLMGGGHIYTPDGVIMFQVTEAMAERGGVEIVGLDTPLGVVSVDDPELGRERLYSWYGVTFSVAAIPGYLAGGLLERFATDCDRQVLDTPATRQGRERYQDRSPTTWDDPRSHRSLYYDTSPASFGLALRAYTTSLTNAFVGAASVALIFLIAMQLGSGVGTTLLITVAAGLGTLLWHYAQTFFSEPLAGLLYLLFLWLVLAARRGSVHGKLLLAGVAMGLIGSTKVALLALGLPAGILWLQEGWGRPLKEQLSRVAAGAVGAGLGLLPFLLYNHARFGSFLDAGYGEAAHQWTTPFLQGLAGLLVSPGRGLLVYCPLVILTLLASPAFLRRDRRVAVFVLLSVLTLPVVFARWHWWDGGWCWGPRFLVPVVPLLALPLLAWLDGSQGEGRRRWILALLLPCVLVSASGLLVNYADYYFWMRTLFASNIEAFQAEGVTDGIQLLRWDPRFAPILTWWTFPVRESLLAPHALACGGVFRAVFLASVASLLASLVGLRWLLRRP
jgi:hypothetical protein